MLFKVRKIFLIAFLGIFFTFALPPQYYPNYGINKYWNDLQDIFAKLKASENSSENPSPNLFYQLNRDLKNLIKYFPKTPNYKVVYDTCLMQTEKLSKYFDASLYMDFKANCFYPLNKIVDEIKTKYTVKASIKAYPKSWPAPLTVTLKAQAYDPSVDTIPANNYFWYYKDSNGVERIIWRWPNVVYTFNRPNTYIVHLTVRSVNKYTKGIWDGEASIAINVLPQIANIVIYANFKKLSDDYIVKIWKQEAKKWVIFDASATTPNGARKIKKYSFVVVGPGGKQIFKRSGEWNPWTWQVSLPHQWKYKITLTIEDNAGEKISKTYYLIVSDPIAIIKVSPKQWTTSNVFNFDASLSYSLSSRIQTYKWIIYDPNGNIYYQTENKKFSKRFIKPGNYTVKLTVIDELWNASDDTIKLYVDSTPPVPQFSIMPSAKRFYPSEFIFDAGWSFDIDVQHGVDKLSYEWQFSEPVNVKAKTFEWWKKVLVDFNKPWDYKVTLIVKDSYWKISQLTKSIKIKSSLRPILRIQPIVSKIWQRVYFNVEANKPISYVEWDFWDWSTLQTQSTKVSHIYRKAGMYIVKAKVSTPSWEMNEIEKYIFVWELWKPIVAYSVYENNVEVLPKGICVIKKGNSQKDIKAYVVHRYTQVKVDASLSKNSKWMDDNLEIYFKLNDGRIKKTKILNYKFDELGCQYIDLYVKDNNIHKIAVKRIYFKVVDTPPTLKWLYLVFPQYWNAVGIWFNQNNQPDMFKVSYDPLLVKVVARDPKDPDGQISYFKWYYYDETNPDNLIDVKITPGNIPYVIFSVPRIPGKYVFGVELCDNDWKCIKSEDIIWKGPEVVFPPSETDPNIPTVKLLVNPVDAIVWEPVKFTIKSWVYGDEKNFKRERIIKVDFDGDWQYDIVTRKTKLTYTYTKPGVYKPKAKVIFRWYAWIGFWDSVYVRKGIKANFLYDFYDKIILIRDTSIWDIISKTYCMDIKKCRKDKNYIIKDKDNFVFKYKDYGNKIIYLSVKDKYWDIDSLKKKINVKRTSDKRKMLSIPKILKENWEYNIYVWKNLDNSVLYYLNISGCFLDPDIVVDENKDWDPSNDRIIEPFQVYLYKYSPRSEYTYARLICSGSTEDIKINFIDFEKLIPDKLKPIEKKINEVLTKLESPRYANSEKIKWLKTLLVNLKTNLWIKDDQDSIILQIKEVLSDIEDEGILDQTIIDDIKWIINKLSDKALRAAFGDNKYEQAKQEIIMLFPEAQQSIIQKIFNEIETSALSPEEIKQKLSQIYRLANQNKDKGIFEAADVNIVLTDLCTILNYYNIPSEKCWTLPVNNIKKVEDGSSTPLWKVILKYILIAFGVIFSLFILLVIIFAIKAKRQQEEQQEEESTN